MRPRMTRPRRDPAHVFAIALTFSGLAVLLGVILPGVLR